MTVVDVASRFKETEPLTSKDSAEVAKSFEKIYRRGPLKWPQLLQVDPGREFMGAVTKEIKKNNTAIRRGRVEIHRDQAIVERFNCTLAERLFGYQYAVEIRLPEGQRSTEWVKRLPAVVSAMNNKVTRLTGKKPAEAMKEKAVSAKPSTSYLRPVGVNEKLLPFAVIVRFFYRPGELDVKVFNIEKSVTETNAPVLYYLRDGPKRGFVREELLIAFKDTVLPPANLAG